MGYDMYFVITPDGEDAKVKAARQVWEEAIRHRNELDEGHPDSQAAQQAAEDAYEAMFDAEVSYFRLNIWGMRRYCNAMATFGMVYRAEEGHPPWPEYDPPKDASPAEEEAWEKEYDRRCEPLRRFHPKGGDTIPDFKFGSNDGWTVTPEEIRAALVVYDMYSPETRHKILDASGIDREYWDKWINYLNRACGYGGFKVY